MIMKILYYTYIYISIFSYFVRKVVEILNNWEDLLFEITILL